MKRESEKKIKADYLPPVLSRITIELEEGIAAGSARISPVSNSGEVKEEWETGLDRERNLNW